MAVFTEAMRQALNSSGHRPARLVDPDTHGALVLLPCADFDWVCELLGDESDAPRVADPQTGASFVLLPERRYERFKSFFEEDPLSPAEKQALLREAGKRAGWDDPAFNEPDIQDAP
jgi:hypothetical protein